MDSAMDCIDTHAHLFVEAFHGEVDAVVARAKEAGLKKVLLPNIDEASIEELKQLVTRHPGFVHPMMGLHPTSVTKEWRKQLDRVYDELTGCAPFAGATRGGADGGGGGAGWRAAGYVAVGEVGIDLYWDDSLRGSRSPRSSSNWNGAGSWTCRSPSTLGTRHGRWWRAFAGWTKTRSGGCSIALGATGRSWSCSSL